ncbi:hypothetical protein CAG99_24245 [Streptomyces marincola]|uniref:AMP-binding enzyme C-terminal domain-containing protein n=1 Tax=Streptomyces marincola TaxID=2878388 RepID=A0A1W7D3D1_9ACTN|nr:hypothetical protein CAG99_24245 [Streptomyces marincola]
MREAHQAQAGLRADDGPAQPGPQLRVSTPPSVPMVTRRQHSAWLSRPPGRTWFCTRSVNGAPATAPCTCAPAPARRTRRAPRPRRPPDARELARFLRARGLAAYKEPAEVIPIADMPLTAVGKTDKKALRESARTRADRSG